MRYFRINQVLELQGQLSKDEWGNETKIISFHDNVITVSYVNSIGLYYKKIPYARDNVIHTVSGAREMLIKDLRAVGFDVVFKRTPYITKEQEQELKLLYKFRDMRWIAKDKDGKVFAYDVEPTQDFEEWFVNLESHAPRFECLIHEWDCVAWLDKEPMEIKKLLKKGVRDGD